MPILKKVIIFKSRFMSIKQSYFESILIIQNILISFTLLSKKLFKNE